MKLRSSAGSRQRTLFVTVGSTKFDQLIAKILSNDIIELLTKKLSFSRLIIQAGISSGNNESLLRRIKKLYPILDIELYNYKSSISSDISQADLVVGHAGAGTALEVLRAGKRLLVVENDSLMDNHQAELADQLQADGYVVRATVSDLGPKLEEICDTRCQLKPFPAKDKFRFAAILSDTLEQIH